MRFLPPSMREKVRYAVIEVLPCDDYTLNVKEVFSSIQTAVKELFGLAGLAEAKLWLIKDSPQNNFFIVKISRSFLNKFKASLLLIKNLNNKKVSVRTIRVSGTLKKAKLFLKNKIN